MTCYNYLVNVMSPGVAVTTRGVTPKDVASMQLDFTPSPGYCQCGCGERTPPAAKTNTKRGLVKGQPIKCVQGHARRVPFDASYTVEDRGHGTPCWLWSGYVDAAGYANARTVRGKKQPAHRVSYERHIGPIPEGLELDHLCRVRHCVNPTHLEPVTPRENTLRGESFAAVNARKTHCKRGHEFTAENTYTPPNTRERWCRTCQRERPNR